MSETANQRSESVTLRAEDVAGFLRRQPDFFERYPEVLRDLNLPHVSGQAVSLFDRQLASLRDENRQLKSNQQLMIENARANEILIKRIHDLALQLMEATGPSAIFSTLTERLKQHFDADRVAVQIFAAPSFMETDGPNEFVGNDSANQAAFLPLFEGGEPKCGELAPDYCQALWPQEPDISGSSALLPLDAKNWRGVLAIQSDKVERFSADMGTEFLRYISDIVCLVVDPWVAREAS